MCSTFSYTILKVNNAHLKTKLLNSYIATRSKINFEFKKRVGTAIKVMKQVATYPSNKQLLLTNQFYLQILHVSGQIQLQLGSYIHTQMKYILQHIYKT